eukprot:4142729-Alexandrium_andersonii.AAC.1
MWVLRLLDCGRDLVCCARSGCVRSSFCARAPPRLRRCCFRGRRSLSPIDSAWGCRLVSQHLVKHGVSGRIGRSGSTCGERR